MQISQFTHGDVTIELTFHNGFLAWSFSYADQPYGAKLEVKSKKVIDIASIAAQLMINAIETYEDLRLSK
jgi:hypothetical protein